MTCVAVAACLLGHSIPEGVGAAQPAARRSPAALQAAVGRRLAEPLHQVLGLVRRRMRREAGLPGGGSPARLAELKAEEAVFLDFYRDFAIPVPTDAELDRLVNEFLRTRRPLSQEEWDRRTEQRRRESERVSRELEEGRAKSAAVAEAVRRMRERLERAGRPLPPRQ
jgi:hypothetical protein